MILARALAPPALHPDPTRLRRFAGTLAPAPIMGPMPVGRFAPTPSAELHLGNLRTALVAWLFARSTGSRFRLRIEDLDPSSRRPEVAEGQLRDLERLGLDWDGPVVRQSEHLDRMHEAVARLDAAGLVYPCFCTRREIAEAARAPHGPAPEGAYPGTCRQLSAAERGARRREGRPAALRLRSGVESYTVVDRRHGPVTAAVDDLVLRRNDGVPAYNLAVVVDDAAQGVEEVVRGDDLLLSTPRQAYLADLLGLPPLAYAHIPLVLGPDGQRLAKRDGAVTLSDRLALGQSTGEVVALLATSIGLVGRPTPDGLLAGFDPERLARGPWVFGG